MSVADQERNPGSVLHWTRRVIALRRAHDALRSGSIELVASDPRLVAFVRAGGGEALLCLFNLGDEPVDAPMLAGRTIVEQTGSIDGSIMAPWSAVVVRWR